MMAAKGPERNGERAWYAALAERDLVRVAGPDARDFLQGLISNDVGKARPERALYAALLTPQGKYLFDFFLVERDGALWLDCEAARADDLVRRLSMYRLRARVEIARRNDGLGVFAVFGPGALRTLGLEETPGDARPWGGGVVFVDPRCAALGARALLPVSSAEQALAAAGIEVRDRAAFDRLRLELGVPDGSRDLEVEKTVLLECDFDRLNGLDWDKGCFVGQEITARMRYRGLVKKRLLPVTVEGSMPPPGTPVMLGSREVGRMRSGRDGLGLALLYLDAVKKAEAEGAPLTAGEARLVPRETARQRESAASSSA